MQKEKEEKMKNEGEKQQPIEILSLAPQLSEIQKGRGRSRSASLAIAPPEPQLKTKSSSKKLNLGRFKILQRSSTERELAASSDDAQNTDKIIINPSDPVKIEKLLKASWNYWIKSLIFNYLLFRLKLIYEKEWKN